MLMFIAPCAIVLFSNNDDGKLRMCLKTKWVYNKKKQKMGENIKYYI